VLRQFLRTNYRGLVTLVAEWQELQKALDLRKGPHYSTLAYAARRLLAEAEKGGPSTAPGWPSWSGPGLSA
jgi:transposase